MIIEREKILWHRQVLLAVVLILAVFWGNKSFAADASRSYILATATTGGTYYPVGVALATTTKVKLAPQQGIALAAISSAGSGENLRLLRQNEAQFAILQGLYGAWAWRGEGPFKALGADKQLRSVTLLWENVEHFVVEKSLVAGANVTDLSGLNGKKVGFSIGKRNSGTEGSGRYILNQLGIDPGSAFDLHYLSYGASIQALQNGKVQGVNLPAGVPVGAVTRVFATHGRALKILQFPIESLNRINAKYPLWRSYEIPAQTYPNQPEAIKTIAQPNFLAVRADVSAEHVYLILKTLYENLGFLNNIHKATKQMSLDKAVQGLPMPLHPGAVKFYRELGVSLTSDLLHAEAKPAANTP